MNRENIKELAKCIVEETGDIVEVLGIEHIGPEGPEYARDFFVKCANKRSGLIFAVKSPGHWADIKQFYLYR
ncbi:MAG: hypothetical protein M3Y81_13940 [Chloroflexota bacterium]|nr:hypothetical protein [Chloroflexota bacterium]